MQIKAKKNPKKCSTQSNKEQELGSAMVTQLVMMSQLRVRQGEVMIRGNGWKLTRRIQYEKKIDAVILICKQHMSSYNYAKLSVLNEISQLPVK